MTATSSTQGASPAAPTRDPRSWSILSSPVEQPTACFTRRGLQRLTSLGADATRVLVLLLDQMMVLNVRTLRLADVGIGLEHDPEVFANAREELVEQAFFDVVDGWLVLNRQLVDFGVESLA